MAKETYDFDFVYTTDDGRQILIPNQSVSDEKKRTELLKAYAKEIAGKLLAAVPDPLAAVDKKYDFTTEDGTVTVDDGYYLITSSLGTNLVLATSNITINTKNEYIVDNKVAETASMTIGENATYYIEVYLPASIDVEKPVIVHDTLFNSFL